MTEAELNHLLATVASRRTETQVLEVKSANEGCQRAYTTPFRPFPIKTRAVRFFSVSMKQKILPRLVYTMRKTSKSTL